MGDIVESIRARSPRTADVSVSVERFGPELADAAVLVFALASSFDIDPEAAIRETFFAKDATRQWRSAEPHP